MTVLGRGDLAPRRRPRRRGRRLLVVLMVAALAVGGWFGYQALRGDDNATVQTTSRPCIQPTHPPSPVSPGAVQVRVLNGTTRAGLAHEVALQLRARGFRIAGVGNNAKRVAQTTVTHPAAGLAGAVTIAEQLPASQLVTGDVRVVTVVLGRDFHRLVTKQQAAKAHASDVQRASPPPSPCPSAAA